MAAACTFAALHGARRGRRAACLAVYRALPSRWRAGAAGESKDRNRHPFLIRLEDVEVTDPAEEIGRKDITFFPPANDGDIYFCLEAKRLNALESGRRRSLGDKYVKEGMQRFVNGKYSRYVHHGGMLGYVLDAKVTRAMKNVEANIRARAKELGMALPWRFLASSVRPDDPSAKETHHRRVRDTALFRIHHLFMEGGS